MIRFLMANPRFALTSSPRRTWAVIRAMREFKKEHRGRCFVTDLPGAQVAHWISVKSRPDLASDKANMVMLIRPIHRALSHPGGWGMSLDEDARDLVIALRVAYDNWRKEKYGLDPETTHGVPIPVPQP